MRPAFVALSLLAVFAFVGCADNAELKKARAEAEEAKAELLKVKAELDAAKTEGKSPAIVEEAVRKVVCEFFLDLSKARDRSAYEFMSDAYKKRVDRKGFDEFMEQHPALRGVAETDASVLQPRFSEIKVRKLAKDNIYECDSHGFGKGEGRSIIEDFTLRVVEEAGTWKIDDFVEIKERK
jgi:hypothetical protein